MQPIFLIEDTTALKDDYCKYYASQEDSGFWSGWQPTEKQALEQFNDECLSGSKRDKFSVIDVAQPKFLVKKVLYNNTWYTYKQFKAEYPEFFL